MNILKSGFVRFLLVIAACIAVFSVWYWYVNGTRVLVRESVCEDRLVLEYQRINRGLMVGHTFGINMFFDGKLVQTVSNRSGAVGSFRPLPVNTKVQTVSLSTSQIRPSEEGPGTDVIFVDPAVFSAAQFSDFVACVRENLSVVSRVTRSSNVNTEIGGFAYLNAHSIQTKTDVYKDAAEFFVNKKSVFAVNAWGVIVVNNRYAGDIFAGIVPEYKQVAAEAKNAKGETLAQFSARIRTKF